MKNTEKRTRGRMNALRIALPFIAGAIMLGTSLAFVVFFLTTKNYEQFYEAFMASVILCASMLMIMSETLIRPVKKQRKDKPETVKKTRKERP